MGKQGRGEKMRGRKREIIGGRERKEKEWRGEKRKEGPHGGKRGKRRK